MLLTFCVLAKSVIEGPTAARLPIEHVTMLNKKWDVSAGERNNRKTLIYNYRMPEEDTDWEMLCLDTYWNDFEVALDDSVIYTFREDYGDLGGRLHFVRLTENYNGKLLTLYLYTNRGISDKDKFECNTYLGSISSVMLKFLKDNAYALLFGILTLLMAILVFGMAAYLRDKLPESLLAGVIWLGFYILFAGIWTVSDSKIMMLVTDKAGMIALISFLSFFCMPVAMIQFVQGMLNKRKRKLDIICRIHTGITTAYLINYEITFVQPFLFVILTHVCILIAMVLTLKYCRDELKENYNRETKRIAQGIAVFAVFILVALGVYYKNPLASYSYIYANGLIVFVIFLICMAMEKSYEYMEQSAEGNAYRKLAMADEMTSLGNRRAFAEKYEKAAPPKELVCIAMDVNNLKTVNDVMGHQKGDELLTAAARHIKEVFGSEGFCYRTGGDEFLVVLEGENSRNVEEKIDKMKKEIQAENKNRGFVLEIAVGYAARSSFSESIEDVYRRADRNMYENKRKTKEEAKQS